jgi:ABC-type nitrate/sulfonate/bicarbonate transport system permease component
LRIALNVALLITIAIELLNSNKGIGYLLWISWETFRPEQMYACLVMLAILGVTFNVFVQWLTRRLVPWRDEPTY